MLILIDLTLIGHELVLRNPLLGRLLIVVRSRPGGLPMYVVSFLRLLVWNLPQQDVVLGMQANRHSHTFCLLMSLIDSIPVLIEFRICFLQMTCILLEHQVYLRLILFMQLLVASFETVGAVAEHVVDRLLLSSIAIEWVSGSRLSGGLRG